MAILAVTLGVAIIVVDLYGLPDYYRPVGSLPPFVPLAPVDEVCRALANMRRKSLHIAYAVEDVFLCAPGIKARVFHLGN
jgi:hypothetical protein